MILLGSGQVSAKAFDALLFLAETLQVLGHTAKIDSRYVPEELSRHRKYEAAPYLVDPSDIEAEKLVIIGADTVNEETQSLLRSAAVSNTARIWAFGRFETRQAGINACNRVAYAMGREPEMVDLALQQKTPLHDDALSVSVTPISARTPSKSTDLTHLMVYVPGDALEDPATLTSLLMLHHTSSVKLHVLTNGTGKTLIQNSRFSGLSVFGLSDLPTRQLVANCDIVAFYGSNMPGPRMANLALHAMGSGRPVIDCTMNHALLKTGAPVLEGPHELQALPAFIESGVRENAHDIGVTAQKSNWLRNYNASWLAQVLDLESEPTPSDAETATTGFFPTNGNGLGHAQRCALVAEEMDAADRKHFAAFPSCVTLLQRRGFDVTPLAQRSEFLSEPYSNDLMNYIRLRNLLNTNDKIVFDGGHVFDSVYRVVSEKRLDAIWVRRGLWQAAQVNPIALERERIFSKIIVPGEAFEELNSDYSQGAHIHHVGPIVNAEGRSKSDGDAIKAKLEETLQSSAKTLVVSMLGGGVASDRTMQTQVICSQIENRPDCMHVIVAWPNAVIPAGYYGWKNSHVVSTDNALQLALAADLTVSAAGYNSFHEFMYAGVPSIMIPQSAPYLDDQERRAQAAADRGLTALVKDTELVKLESEISAFLDGGKADEIRAALGEITLPEIGNKAAATIIQSEMAL
ncbi:MAG: glycosyltransferase [Boseongicola sp.]|nr:glycosyltransferase [Boseongicola sp.]